MKTVQVRRLKDLERENGRLKKAVAELSLDKLILKEALEGNDSAPTGVGAAWSTLEKGWTFPSGMSVG